MKVANFMVEHNVPLAVSDHLSPLFRDIFPDSSVAKKYASCRTKTICMLNMAITPHFHGKNGSLLKLLTHIMHTHTHSHMHAHIQCTASLVEDMHVSPFSLLVDGSNDTGVEKLNPLTVKRFDNSKRQVTTCLLDMCTTTGRDCGTATVIFTKIHSVLSKFHIPWSVWDLVSTPV